jgi:twitching motility protein PilT
MTTATTSMLDLTELLTFAVDHHASDIHLVPGHYPFVNVHEQLSPVETFGLVRPEDTERMVRQMVGDERFRDLETNRDLDFSTKVPNVSRFRVNAHYQKNTIGIAFRIISSNVPEVGTLGLPPIIQQMINLPRGLVLVTGPTGSGKSTTLASLIQSMNLKQRRHVITVEDPIEYELISRECLIEQREVGGDVPNFASGLRHALRQAPDVILVGEMRDLETTSAAISAAETGHLVFSTLHTQSASQTVERIIDIYPGDQQNYILSMLANTLQAVVTQTLFTRVDQPGMIPATEVMLCNSAVRNCIRENRLHEIPNIIETSRNQGMCLLDDTIKTLVLNGLISPQMALERANQPAMLRKALQL